MAQKLVRCIEGHVYDSSQNEQCPICGARDAQKEESAAALVATGTPDLESPIKAAGSSAYGKLPRQPVLIGGAACAVLLALAGLWASGLIGGSSSTTEQEAAKSTAENGAAPAGKDADGAAKTSPPANETSDSGASEKATANASASVTECDRLAASPLDPDRPAGVEGVLETRKIDAAAAVPACETATKTAPNERRLWVNLARSYRSAKNDIAAVPAYRKAAELGSVFGSYGLGVALRDNPSVQRDPQEARLAIESAARAGLPVAMFELGNMLARGQAVEIDLAQSRQWLEKAADANYPPAMNTFGVYLLNGTGGAADFAKARDLFERAGKQGSVDALASLGAMYESGKGVDKNLTTAQDYYRQAADGGSMTGMRRLAQMLVGYGNVDEARSWLTKAADQGDTTAMVDLSRLYREGTIGGQPDYLAARQLLEKAAQAGDGQALSDLGYLYQNGLGVPRNYEIARSWYEKSAERGNTTGMTNLGVTYEFGLSVPQNFIEAWRLYEKAAALGDTNAMLRLGEMIESGKGVARDPAGARNWYIKAAERGDATGYWRATILTDRYGINPDRAALARNVLEAIRQGCQEALQAVLKAPQQSMSRELRAAVEEELAHGGYYNGPTRGQFDSRAREAVKAFLAGPSKQNRIN